MTVSYRTGITILQFIYFVPAMVLALVLCVKQGWKSASSSWRFIVILSLLRIAGDISYFVTLDDPSVSAYVAVIICDLMGLAPLTLVCNGLLARVNNIHNRIPGKYFAGVSFVSLVGLIVGVVGAVLAVDTTNSGATYTVTPTIKAALALFIACFGLMFCAFLKLSADAVIIAENKKALGHEIYIIYAVALSIPFLLIRLVYACIADYKGDPRFNFFDGDDTIYLCMGVLVELIVATICLIAGFLVPPPDHAQELDNERGSESAELAPTTANTDENGPKELPSTA